MLILEGNNLGERHRNLNSKVQEAVDNHRSFDEVKSQAEECDVDKLFNIDLASRYKNIDYILEVLKCGDNFHITRALKCLWLYDDDYSQFINPSYLENNIFPFMSMKKKREMVTTISLHVRNAVRVVDFYQYCKTAKMNEYALKFLAFTPEKYKLDLMENESSFYGFRDSAFLKQFIGSSFIVAQAYTTMRKNNNDVKHKLRFLYSVSNENYLNFIEKFTDIDPEYSGSLKRFGIRISKHILKNYKSRIISYPLLYINKLNERMLVKYLTIEDVRSLGFALLPMSSDDFWSEDFYRKYNFIFQKIPVIEIFAYMKNLYTSKYKDEFEMTVEFYESRYYEMFSLEEREAWALRHIERDEDLPGIENYIWFRFVSCAKAINGIKRFIFLTPDADKRSRIVNMLPETARSQEELITVLSYYYQRHVNENEEYKESFIDKIILRRDIFSFNTECWTLLDQLFYSLEVYSSACSVRIAYKAISMIYHILHDEDMPEGLQEFVDCIGFCNNTSIIDELSEDKKAKVAKYLINHYVEPIESIMEIENDETRYSEIDYLVYKIQSVIQYFNRPYEYIPEIVLQFIKPDVYEVVHKPKFIPKTEEDFVRWLKQDIQMVIDGLEEIRCNAYRWRFRLTRLFRKLKVYFPNDVGIKYLEYFTKYLSDVPKGRREYRNIKIAIVGVFYLADENYVIDFLEKYVPVTPKIDRINIDNRVFQVQKAICRLAYHKRPPLQVSSVRKYITGDYVHFCLPIFNNYLTNLPTPREFVDAVLDAPLSIQKYGLRHAFIAYSPVALNPIIITAWKRTENVSLRKILYQKLFERLLKEHEEAQKELYEVLKLFTSELNHDDHKDVYSLLVSADLPDVFKGNFIETAWLSVSKLSDKDIDIERKISIICHMERYIHFVQREFLRVQIIDDHVDVITEEMMNKRNDYYTDKLIESKWDLTAKYIVHFNNDEEQQQSLGLLQTIITRYLNLKRFVPKNTHTYGAMKFILNFTETIKNKDSKTRERCGYIVPVYKCILDSLQSFFKREEIYLINLELTLLITCNKIIHEGIKKLDSNTGSPRSTEAMACIFGKAVATLVESLVQKDEFYRCFYDAITNIVSNIGNTFCGVLNMDKNCYLYHVCNEITDIKIRETHILALNMLPIEPTCDWSSEHMRLFTKIQLFDDKALRCWLYKKYVSSDFNVRSYIVL